MLLEIKKGSVTRKGKAVLRDFDFSIRGTEKAALVGRNGAGKTTLLEVLAGICPLDPDAEHPESGMSWARSATVHLLGQQGPEHPDRTVEEEALAHFPGAGNGPEEEAEKAVWMTNFQKKFTELGFDLDDRKKKMGQLSGGQQKKVMLILAFMKAPDILLLDEPTNHLDLKTTLWPQDQVKAFPGALIQVSHDRFFIDETVQQVWELAAGRLTCYQGGYSAYRREKAKRVSRQEKAYQAQQEEIAREKALIEKFKHRPRKAAFARSRVKMLERMERVPKPQADDALIHTGDILPSRPGSRRVLDCKDAVIGYDRPLKAISFRLARGRKVGVFGANGTGKSTFLKTAAGLMAPLGGKLRLGENIDIGYFDQMSGQIHSGKSVFDWFHDCFPALTGEEERRYLAGFLFKGKSLGQKVDNLSGGEKARLALARILYSRPNLLLLDEPTNNMDIPAMETIESILKDYKGSMIFVTHDRYFLSQVADSLLFFEEDGAVRYYPFDYRHFADARKAAAAGLDPAGVTDVENQRLAEGIRAVPKGSNLLGHALSTEELYESWRFDQNRPGRKAAEEAFAAASERFQEDPQTPEEYEDWESRQEKARADLEAARAAWTEKLLEWYDIWLELSEDPE